MKLYQKNENIKEFLEQVKILEEQDFIEHKKQQNEVINLYSSFSLKKVEQLENCATFLEFGLYTNEEEYKKKLERSNFCKDRFCPMCNWRRSRKLGIQNYKVLKQIEQDKKVRYIFTTFTIKNCKVEDLKETIQHMNKSFKRMVQTKRFKNSVIGFIKTLEVPFQKNDSSMVHPHFHCLFVVPTSYFKSTSNLYIKQTEWKEMWKKSLRIDYEPSVDVRIIKSNKKSNDPIAGVVAETIKYPLKSISLKNVLPEHFKIMVKQIKGLRLISYGGIIKEYRDKLFNNDKEEDLIFTNTKELETWIRIGILYYRLDNGNYVLNSFIEENNDKEDIP